jgi:uncharacterized protein (TIRG00374 family)
MKKKFDWKKIFNIALFALSIGMLTYFCIADNNLVTLFQSLPSLNLFWLLGAAGCMLLYWIMDSRIVFHIIQHAYSGGYSGKKAFKVTMIGQYFNSVSPFAVAGQPMQLLALSEQGVSSGIAISALVHKFLIYQTTITLYSLLVIVVRFHFFHSKIQGFMALAFIGFACQAGVVVMVALFTYNRALTTKLINLVVWLLTKLHLVKKPQEVSKKVQDQLEFYISNNKAVQGNRILSAKLYGFTAIQLTALFAVPFFIYKAFHNPGAPIVDIISAQSFVTMISSYTPLPGASGAAEGSFLVLFQLFFTPAIIRQAMLLWRLITYYSCIIAGAFFAGMGVKNKDVPHAKLSIQEQSPLQTANKEIRP